MSFSSPSSDSSYTQPHLYVYYMTYGTTTCCQAGETPLQGDGYATSMTLLPNPLKAVDTAGHGLGFLAEEKVYTLGSLLRCLLLRMLRCISLHDCRFKSPLRLA